MRVHKVLAPRLSRSFVEARAAAIVNWATGDLRLADVVRGAWCFDFLYRRALLPRLGIKLQEEVTIPLCDGGSRLAEYDVESNTIRVSSEISAKSRDPRRMFTLCHEAGHAVLHGALLRGCLHAGSSGAIAEVIIDPTEEIAFEQQANWFAAAAAAPLRHVDAALLDTFGHHGLQNIRYRGPCFYALNNRTPWISSEDDLIREVARTIQWRFGGLSLESLGYRVRESTLGCRLLAVPTEPPHRSERPPQRPTIRLARKARRERSGHTGLQALAGLLTTR